MREQAWSATSMVSAPHQEGADRHLVLSDPSPPAGGSWLSVGPTA